MNLHSWPIIGGLLSGDTEAGASRKIVIGLGNPGREYAATRHNVGHWCIDRLAELHSNGRFRRSRLADVAEATIEGQRVVLAKPRTYVNNSGRAVTSLMAKYRAAPGDLLVVYDEMDLSVREHQASGPGRLRRTQRHEVDHRCHGDAGVPPGSGSAWGGRPAAAMRSSTCWAPCPVTRGPALMTLCPGRRESNRAGIARRCGGRHEPVQRQPAVTSLSPAGEGGMRTHPLGIWSQREAVGMMCGGDRGWGSRLRRPLHNRHSGESRNPGGGGPA